jgi:hypothetical protein
VIVVNQISPTVLIFGSKMMSMTAASMLTVASVASTTLCDGSVSYEDLSTSWTVTATEGSSVAFKSLSSNALKLILGAFTLAPGRSYTITATATNTLSFKSSSNFITVRVVSSALVARVVGGSVRSFRVSTTFSLDGSISYDPDQPNFGNSGLSYSWSCVQLSPYLGSGCLIELNVSTVSGEIVEGRSDVVALNSSSSITLLLSDSATSRHMSLAVAATITAANAPLVSINTVLGAVIQTSGQFALSATVSLSRTALISWSISDTSVSLSSISLTEIVFHAEPTDPDNLGEYSLNANLVLPANSLPAGATLVFSLSCQSLQTSSLAIASVTVVTNAQPAPGLFEVFPSTGEELSVVFSFFAFSWTDSDIPLTYEFGFVAVPGQSYQVIQGKSQLSHVGAVLPAGLEVYDHTVVAFCRIFDSYGANSSASTSITVTPMQLNNSQLKALATAGFAASSGSADGTRQMLSTFGAVANRANCSASPNCTLLNREPCSSVDHTCGACISPFLGSSGDSNDACFTAAGLVGRRLDQVPDTVKKLCVHDCFNNGVCVFENTAGEAVNDCFLSDISCSAVCTCFSGYTGYSCSVTDQDLAPKIELRSQLVDSFQLLTALDYPDEQTIQAWSNNAVSITGVPYELSDDSINRMVTIASVIISAAGDSAVTFSSLAGMAAAIDNLVSTAAFSSSSARRALSTTDSVNSSSLCVSELIDELGALLMSEMISGQNSQQYIGSRYSVTAQVFDMSRGGDASLSIPVSALEQLTGSDFSNTVSFDGLTGSQFAVSLISLLSVAFTDSESFGSAVCYNCRSGSGGITNTDVASSTLLARPVRAVLDSSVFECQSNSNNNAVFTLRHSTQQVFGVVSNISESFIVDCTVGHAVIHNYTCGNGVNITAQCSGRVAGKLYTKCPQKIHRPTCLLANTDIEGLGCYVANYSGWHTTCVCNLCDGSTPYVVGYLRRKLPSVGTLVMELSAASSYIGDEYTSIMLSAAQYSNVQSLWESIVVICAFVVLWGTIILFGGIAHWFSKKRSSSHFSRATHPMHIISFDSTDWKRHNVRGKSVDSFRRNSRHETGSGGCIENKLEAYMTSLLPDVFADRPSADRLFRSLVKNHKYFRVFVNSTFIGYLDLLSNLTVVMFLLAVFYDLQWPADDGTCQEYMTEVACLHTKSVFDDSQSKCSWRVVGDIGSCLWSSPRLDVKTMVVISIIVTAISVPITCFIQLYIQFLLMPATRTDAETKINHIRPLSKDFSGRLTKFRGTIPPKSPIASTGSRPSRFFEVNPSLQRQTIVANNSAVQAIMEWNSSQRLIVSRKERSMISGYADYYFNVDNLTSDLRRRLRCLRSAREKARFVRQWPYGIFSVADDDCEQKDNLAEDVGMIFLAAELNRVKAEVASWEHHLRGRDSAFISIQLIELFIADLLGRDSVRAKIFINLFNNIQRGFYVSRRLKIVASACLLLMDGYFIFVCMLYGKDKGFNWQFGWLVACAASLTVDMFIQQAQVSLMVFYVIPNAVFDTARVLKIAFRQAISAFCDRIRNRDKASDVFGAGGQTATDYLFVSAHLARLYPDLLESSIILSFQSFSVPTDLSNRWKHPRRFQFWTFYSSGWSIMSSLDFGYTLSIVMTTVVLHIGSLPLSAQHMVFGLLNPISVALLGYIGSEIISSSLLGSIIAVCFVLLLAMVGYYLWRRHESHKIRLVSVLLGAKIDNRDDAGVRDDYGEIINDECGEPVLATRIDDAIDLDLRALGAITKLETSRTQYEAAEHTLSNPAFAVDEGERVDIDITGISGRGHADKTEARDEDRDEDIVVGDDSDVDYGSGEDVYDNHADDSEEADEDDDEDNSDDGEVFANEVSLTVNVAHSSTAIDIAQGQINKDKFHNIIGRIKDAESLVVKNVSIVGLADTCCAPNSVRVVDSGFSASAVLSAPTHPILEAGFDSDSESAADSRPTSNSLPLRPVDLLDVDGTIDCSSLIEKTKAQRRETRMQSFSTAARPRLPPIQSFTQAQLQLNPSLTTGINYDTLQMLTYSSEEDDGDDDNSDVDAMHIVEELAKSPAVAALTFPAVTVPHAVPTSSLLAPASDVSGLQVPSDEDPALLADTTSLKDIVGTVDMIKRLNQQRRQTRALSGIGSPAEVTPNSSRKAELIQGGCQPNQSVAHDGATASIGVPSRPPRSTLLRSGPADELVNNSADNKPALRQSKFFENNFVDTNVTSDEDAFATNGVASLTSPRLSTRLSAVTKSVSGGGIWQPLQPSEGPNYSDLVLHGFSSEDEATYNGVNVNAGNSGGLHDDFINAGGVVFGHEANINPGIEGLSVSAVIQKINQQRRQTRLESRNDSGKR